MHSLVGTGGGYQGRAHPAGGRRRPSARSFRDPDHRNGFPGLL